MVNGTTKTLSEHLTGAPVASNAQRGYIRNLLKERPVPPAAREIIAQIAQGQRSLTQDEASHLIDALRCTPTFADIARRDAEAKRDHLWGKDGVSEEVTAQRWDRELEPYFHIQREIHGRHWSGQRLRIDRILWPRFHWSNGSQTPIGFEIKTAAGLRNDTSQASDYANTRWELRPPHPAQEADIPTQGLLLVALHRDTGEDSRPLAPHGCLAFVIGHEYRDVTLSIYFNGQRMWSDLRGVTNNNWSPRRKFGAR